MSFKWALIFLIISGLSGFAGFSAYGFALSGFSRVLFFMSSAMMLVASALSIFRIH